VLDAFPEIDLAQNKVGIFSKLVKLDEKVRDRDRVEIYRPLIADPKEVRRKRAEAGKVTKKGGGDAAPDTPGRHEPCAQKQRPSGMNPEGLVAEAG
jgi:hypothetical protein